MASKYYTPYETQINNQYNQAVSGIDKTQEADKRQAEQQYTGYRNQASVNAAKNQMALREQMAQQGLFKSGDNITASTQINNQRSADINKANMDQGNYLAQLQQEKYKQMQELEMARQNALREALTQSQEWDYRDNRDTISDQRYKTEWDYNKSQDQLTQSNWERQFAKTGSGGGGDSSSSTATTTKSNVWDEFSQQFANGVPSNAATWLGSNKEEIIDAVGQTEYNKMSQVVYEQQRKYNDDNKNKRNNKNQAY